jgi:hypothetical protein
VLSVGALSPVLLCDAALLLSLTPIYANYLFNAYDVAGLPLHVDSCLKMSTTLL